MLSEVLKTEKTDGQMLQTFTIPSVSELANIIEERKDAIQRSEIIDAGGNDPVASAKAEANRIILEAQQHYKEKELEANVLKSRQEQAIRTQLESEFSARVDSAAAEYINQLGSSVQELMTAKNSVINETREKLMELVFVIAGKVIGETFDREPDRIISMIEKGFQKISGALNVKVSLNPEDGSKIDAEKLKQVFADCTSVNIEMDGTVERGGARIESELGDVSTEPGHLMEVIKEELMNV